MFGWCFGICEACAIASSRSIRHGRETVTCANGINRSAIPDRSRPEGDSDFHFVPAENPDNATAWIVELVMTRIPKRFGFHPVPDIQVLWPMNRAGAGARSPNIELQTALNPAGTGKPSGKEFGTTREGADGSVLTARHRVTILGRPQLTLAAASTG